MAEPAPELCWPVQFAREEALALVRRRLPRASGLAAEAYHHPMMGVVYEALGAPGSSDGRPERLHVLVDLVGGRAYAAQPWSHIGFVAVAEAPSSDVVDSPVRVVSDEAALTAARQLAQAILLRTRRLGATGSFELVGRPLVFGKPNWWVTGAHAGRDVEIIVDAVTGKHYALSA